MAFFGLEPQAHEAHQLGAFYELSGGVGWWIRPSSLFRSVFAGEHHHHHGRRRRHSRLLAAPFSPPSAHDQRDLRFVPAAAAPRRHLLRALRPIPAVRAGIGAGAGGQPQVPQREGGRGRRGRGRGGAPAAVHVAGVARGRHGGDQAAAEARGRAGQAQAQGPVRGPEVPPEVRPLPRSMLPVVISLNFKLIGIIILSVCAYVA